MDERAFDERYRHWAQRSGELFTEASRYIPGGAGSSARTVKFGWTPYPPFMAEGSGRGCATSTGMSTSTTCWGWAR